MSRIVIAGTTTSGKTCYFYAMLRKMMRGISGFSVRVAEKDYAQLRLAMKRLGDKTLPLAERFPKATSEQENYTMDLLYNLRAIDTFEWNDYPGEFAEIGDEKFLKLLENATCLLLCVDGSQIQGDMSDIEDIIDTIYNDAGGMDLCNILQQAERRNEGGFPPVCVMVTKYDKVSEELRNIETITEILVNCFPVLFTEGDTGKNRVVTICPVTLGKDLENNGPLDPKNVEKPICFANYLIQLRKLQEYIEKANSLLENDQKQKEQYKKRSFFGKIISPKPQPLTEEQKQAMKMLFEKGKKDLEAVRNMIVNLPLYLNGVKTDWPEL